VAAARAYNVEAGRVGRHLNVIPPAGAAGAGAGVGAGGDAGPKRAAPTTLATFFSSKKMRLWDIPSGATDAGGVTAAQRAKLNARVEAAKNKFDP